MDYNIIIDKFNAWLQVPEVLMGLGGALVLLSFYLMFKSAFRPIRVVSSKQGVVEVTRSALHSLVYAACESVGMLKKPGICITMRRGKIDMRLKAKIPTGENLSHISSELQERLRSSFAEALGVDQVGAINIVISGFNGASGHSTMQAVSLDDDSK